MERNKELALMLVKFYNMCAGSAHRLGEDADRLNTIFSAIDRGDVSDLKAWIKEYVASTPSDGRDLMECMRSYKGFEKAAEPAAPVTPIAPAAPVSDATVNYSMNLLEQAVIGLIAKANSEKIETAIMGQVEDKVRDFIKSEYGTIERKITTVVDGVARPMSGVQHERFETVLKFVANNEPVFLTGPAGSGKNVLCKQVAEALGLNFYFTNAVTQEYKLTGFTDAMGKFHETQFYKAFTEGGLFMLDEMDASIPEVLVILNAAIANRYFDFPAPIGYVEAHPDFRVIAAGNTIGHGADASYVGRNQLDGASLDRFALIEIDYSPSIEDSVAGDKELADFCRDFRKAAEKAGVQVIVSYRGIGRLAKMLHLLTIREALETCLLKGLERDDVNMILGKMRRENKYRAELTRMVA